MSRHLGTSRLVATIILAVGASACSSGNGADTGSSSTVTSVAPATSTTPARSTTAPGSPTSVDCSPKGDLARKADGFPNRMSSLIGRDLRSAVFDACTERVVVELQGSGAFPGWQVEYPDRPPTLGESDLPVDIAGEATLVATLESWMTTMEGDGYQGPTDIFPPGTQAIKEIRLIENFEGVMSWAIGLDRQRPFTVTVLDDPPRLVIDLAVA